MTSAHACPHLLLVEDDPVSASYLSQALLTLPATVETANSVATAGELVTRGRHHLWLLDAHLPDGDGLACLAALRGLAPSTPALAITASTDRDELSRLAAGGFIEVLQKPLSVAALQAAVHRCLDGVSPTASSLPLGKSPVWDEERALRAVGGRPESLAKLRELFLHELPIQREQIVNAARQCDAGTVAAVAHRLVAGCGFVGAARLGDASRALCQSPLDRDHLAQFLGAADDVVASVS